MNRHLLRDGALVALALACFAPLPGVLAAQDYRDAYPRNPGIDVLGYVFELTLSDETDEISGVAMATARYLTGGQRELRLDLVQPSDTLNGGGMTVSRVETEGRELAFRHEGHQLFIDLGRVVEPGERVRVRVHYAGRPAGGLVIGPNTYGDRTFFSDNWSSRVRHWLPVVDHPYDKATTEMIVVAPSHYQIASNGTVVEESDLGDGTRRTHYVNPVPTATWLYFVGVARFAVQQVDRWEDVPIETWVYWQDRDAGFHDFAEPSKKVLAYYADLVGPYVYDRLANVVSTATGGGMEAASTPAYSEASVSGTRERRWQNVIIHEIAHQWFGNAVTEADWNDVWLSEGFATYYTLLFRRHLYGHDDFVAGLRDSRTTVRDFYRDQDYDFRLVRDYVADLNDVSGRMMYDKGAWILHM
ncbi:MAG TPA: M1 family metallopeptidase, partial [Longimicrobiales bacterium]|nr:M1 family metallopeptidase [Longimicrobiales bacterium]